MDSFASTASGPNLFLLQTVSHRVIVHVRCFTHKPNAVISQRRKGKMPSDILGQVAVLTPCLLKRAAKPIVGKSAHQ
jgi:hypothetical protein